MSTVFVDPAAQAKFLTLLPRIENHARIHFRDIECADTKADRVAECAALGWKWYVRLHERGKDVGEFPMVFVFYIARAVRSGRRAVGHEKANDVMSPVAQHKHGLRVERLACSTCTNRESLYGDPTGQRREDAYEERLSDNSITPPDEQAMFRIDFGNWLQTLSGREQTIVEVLSRDESTGETARRFGVSPGRISQMRKQFREDWECFCGDEEEKITLNEVQHETTILACQTT